MIELVDMTSTIGAWVVRKPNGGLNSFHYAVSFRNREGAIQWIQQNDSMPDIYEFELVVS
jgi:hypothetical protein